MLFDKMDHTIHHFMRLKYLPEGHEFVECFQPPIVGQPKTEDYYTCIIYYRLITHYNQNVKLTIWDGDEVFSERCILR